MPAPRKRKARRLRDDWFLPAQHPHFDAPITGRRAAEEVLARFYAAPRQHGFLPFMSFEKRVRRWRYDGERRRYRASWKVRPLAYCSNADTHIFAAVGLELSRAYEAMLAGTPVEAAVVGYRRDRSNIRTAHEAFSHVSRLAPCTALALDISSFFPTISHQRLKRCWSHVLGGGLPDSHYAVFQALTRYATVDRKACLRRLGLDHRATGKDLARPLCSMDQFRQMIRGRRENTLIRTNPPGRGIPQGTPISAIAANVSMWDFDKAMTDRASEWGGIYRRYSDDILLIVPCNVADATLDYVTAALKDKAGDLVLNGAKAQRVDFLGSPLPSDVPELQYLGFTFNGERTLLRASTISKFYNRMRQAVRWAERCQASTSAKKLAKGNREGLQRKAIISALTHIGKDSFVRTYAKAAERQMGSAALRRQLRNHVKVLNSLTRPSGKP